MNLNLRQRTSIIFFFIILLLISIFLGGIFLSNDKISTNLEIRNLPPSVKHLFGTDWMGRDMFARTLKSLTLSIGTGMLAAFISAVIALFLGLLSGVSKKVTDSFIMWLVDVFLSIPHLLTLILIAFAIGGGVKGVVMGVALTHWPSLTRVIRAEILQLKSAEFVQVSRHLGKSRWQVVTGHILPHIWSQFFIGLILIFPHAILHEASITFLGFGLSPHQPAIGVILSESMRYLSTGMWWLAFFPGLCLFIVVRLFDVLGEYIRILLAPHSSHY